MIIGGVSISNPHHNIKRKKYQPFHRDEFEANYVATRKQAFRGRMIFTLEWSNKVLMPESEFQQLETLIEAEKGNAVTWVHPFTKDSVEVFFSEDAIEDTIELLDPTSNEPLYRSLRLILETY